MTPAPLRLLAVPALAAALALSPLAAHAQEKPQAYRLDPVHTRVLVAVSHAGFSDALGAVSGSTGTLWFDPADWRSARLEVEVPLARLDFGDAKWNQAVLAPRLLDAQAHPVARFVSGTVEPLDQARANVCGQLTLRGVTGPLCLEVRLNALKRHPLPPFRRTAGFSATATLSRAAFGIDAWPRVIGDRVALRIEAEAVRGGGHDEEAPASDPPSAASASIEEPAADAAPSDTPPDPPADATVPPPEPTP